MKKLSGSEDVAAYRASGDECVMGYTSQTSRLIGKLYAVKVCLDGWRVYLVFGIWE